MKPACKGDKNHHEHKLHSIREKLYVSNYYWKCAKREAQNVIFNSFYVHDHYHKRIKKARRTGEEKEAINNCINRLEVQQTIKLFTKLQ